jgi:hypothetical protein
MLADRPPAHRHSSFAIRGYSAVRIAIVSVHVNKRSDVKNIATGLKRINRSTDALVVALNLRYPLILGKQ